MKLLLQKILSKHTSKIDVIFISIIIFCFYFYKLGNYSVFIPDEGRYSEIAREMLTSRDWITPTINGLPFLDKPPLHYWLQALAMKAFGLKEWVLRLFPVLFALWGILLTYIVTCKVVNRRSGLIAAFILATSPLYYICAHYADMNMEISILTCTALFFFLWQTHNKSHQTLLLVGMYIAIALGFLTKGLIGVVFPGLIISAWLILTKQWRGFQQIKPIAGIFIVAVISLPWLHFIQKSQPNFFQYFFIDQQFARFITQQYNNKSPAWFYIPVILLGFFPWSLFFIEDIKNRFRKRMLNQWELFLYLWVLIIFCFFSIPASKLIAYILPILPALAIIVSKRIDSLWEMCLDKKLQSTWALIFLIISLLYIISAHHTWIDYSHHFKKYLYFNAFIYSILALMLGWKSIRLSYLVLFCVFANGITQASLISGAHHLNTQSSKKLTMQMQHLIKPQDLVVMFFYFSADVPLYANQLVYVIDIWQKNHIPKRDFWKRELAIGSNFAKNQTVLLNPSQLRKLWLSQSRLFVFLKKQHLIRIQLSRLPFYIIADNHDKLLISNKAK